MKKILLLIAFAIGMMSCDKHNDTPTDGLKTPIEISTKNAITDYQAQYITITTDHSDWYLTNKLEVDGIIPSEGVIYNNADPKHATLTYDWFNIISETQEKRIDIELDENDTNKIRKLEFLIWVGSDTPKAIKVTQNPK